MATEVHDTSPEVALLVFVDSVDYVPEIALGRLQVASFVLWRDVTPVSLHWLLGETLRGGWRVVSPEAVEDVVTAAERRRHARHAALQHTDIERSVLDC